MEMQMTIGGLRVINARRPIIVTVKPRDISRGRTEQAASCAAAKAAMSSIPNCVEARIHRSRVYIKRRDRDVWERYQTGGALRDQLMIFDRGGRFQPGEYELLPPVKARARTRGTKNRNRKRTHVRRARKLHVAEGVRPRMGAHGDAH
jgi:hypothetical protein